MSAKKKQVRFLVPTSTVTASFRKGNCYWFDATRADKLIASGAAEYVPTHAELLAEYAKEYGVDLVTTNHEVTTAANAIGWGSHVSAPKPTHHKKKAPAKG